MTLKNEQEELKHLMAEILERTDMMWNAIQVDEFDAFESSLDYRAVLLEKYNDLKGELEPAALAGLELDVFIKNVIAMDSQIFQELERFKDGIMEENQKNVLSKNQLLQNVKKTNKYQTINELGTRGHIFDKHK